MRRTLTIAFIICAIAVPAFAQRNLVRNPGFEDGLDGWRFWGGGAPGEIVLETEDVASGEGALRLTNPSAAKVRAYQPSVQLNQDEPRPVHLRYRVKRGATDPNALQCIDLYGRNMDGTGVGLFANTSVERVGEWVLMEHTFVPDKPIAHLGAWALSYDSTADVLFDDIEFWAEAPEHAPARELIAIGCDAVAMRFVAAGARVQIRDLRVPDGRAYLEGPDGILPGVNLWEVALRGPEGGMLRITPDDGAQLSAQPQPGGAASGATLTWQGVAVDGRPVLDVTVSATVVAGDPLARLTCEVTLHDEAYELASLRFPVLAEILPLGGDPTDDSLAWPRGIGALIRDPFSNPTAVAARYPSSGASMQLMALTDPQGGLYLAPHDGAGHLKVLNMSAEVTAGLRYSVEHQPPAGARQWSTPYPVAIGPVTGGWYEAARLYRQWATEQEWCRAGTLAERDVPAPVTDTDVWMVGHIARDKTDWTRPPERSLTEVRALTPDELREQYPPLALERNRKLAEDFEDYFGVPVGWWWTTWMLPAFDVAHGRQTWPRQFEETIAAVEDAGVPVIPYTNIRRFDTGIPEWQTLDLASAAVINAQGQVVTEPIKEGATAVMCPASEHWQDYFAGYCAGFVQQGVTGLYLDELGTAGAAPCYATEHGHEPGPGNHWVQGRREMLRKLRAACEPIEPDFFTGGEEPCEVYIDLNDLNFTYGSRYPDNIPLWQAVYHDYSVCQGRPVGKWYDASSMLRNYPEDEQAGDVKIDEFITAQAQALVLGIQPGWVRPDLPTYAPEAAAWYRTLVQTWQRAKPWLLFGEMLPEPRIVSELPTVRSTWRYKAAFVAELPAVLCSAWRAPDGSTAIVLANISEDEQTVTLETGIAGHEQATATILARGFEVMEIGAE